MLETIKLAYNALQGPGKEPKIAVADLNPHASDGGIFGTEEIKEIAPAIQSAKNMGINTGGPFLQTPFSSGRKRKNLMESLPCIMTKDTCP